MRKVGSSVLILTLCSVWRPPVEILEVAEIAPCDVALQIRHTLERARRPRAWDAVHGHRQRVALTEAPPGNGTLHREREVRAFGVHDGVERESFLERRHAPRIARGVNPSG
jgi:hypothetical protein